MFISPLFRPTQNEASAFPVGHDLFHPWFSSRRTCGLCQSWQTRVTPQSPLTWSSWLTLTPEFAVCCPSKNFSRCKARTQTSACPRYVSHSTTFLHYNRAPWTPTDTISGLHWDEVIKSRYKVSSVGHQWKHLVKSFVIDPQGVTHLFVSGEKLVLRKML